MTGKEDVSRTIGARVRAARAAAELSRKRLAEKADVSERYLHQLESGDANVSVGILGRVADAVGVSLVSLFPTGAAGSTIAEATAHGATSGLTGPGLPEPLVLLLARMSPREQEDAAAILERWLADRRKALRGVALLGLRGAGKSTIGALFARRHGLPFLSVTREIEQRAGMSLTDLFNLGGPEAYRTLENEVVRELSGRNDRIVLETAGGIVSNAPALEMILAAFKTVWLKAAPREHLQRVIGQGDMRPMQATPKALEHLEALLASREPEYARADCVLDTTGRAAADCVDELDRIAGSVVAPAVHGVHAASRGA